jgi:hypothetical protein
MAGTGRFTSPTSGDLARPRSAALLDRIAVVVNDSRWYACQVCGNMFENRYALMGHMNAHRKPPPGVRYIRLFGVDIIVIEDDPDEVAE